VRARSLRVTVTGLRGEGFNRVGIAEVQVPGVQLTRVARLPETLARLARAGDVSGDLLRRTPVDVVLTRVATTPDDGRDDEETGLERELDLPDGRDFRVYGVLRAQGAVSEPDLDRLSGASGRVTASSSSHAFDLPGDRASAALDGDPGTAWVPGNNAVGESLTVDAPPRQVDHITVVQRRGDDPTHATRARVELDGQVVADAPLRPHRTRIDFPARTAATMRLTLLGRSGSGVVRIAEVGFGGAQIRADAGRAGTACVPVATLDGRELEVHPLAPVTGRGPLLFRGCAVTTSLAAGRHRLSAVPGWTLDRLVLRDSQGEVVRPPAAAPRLTVDSPRPTSYRITNASTTAPWTLVLGQAYDARWRAEVDGKDLGPPQVVDGYSAGWTITAPGEHVIEVRYGPQRSADVALALSGAGVLIAGALVLAPVVTRRGSGPLAPSQAPARPAGGARASRRVRRPSRRLGWLVTVALALLAGGWWLALAAAALAVWDLARRPAPTTVIGAGVACWALLPVVWYAGNSARWGEVTPRLVAGNPWPHVVAFVGLLLVVVGVVRQELEDGSGRLARRD
jgi:arabinofuranan 3-O-arabinosyltransferase